MCDLFHLLPLVVFVRGLLRSLPPDFRPSLGAVEPRLPRRVINYCAAGGIVSDPRVLSLTVEGVSFSQLEGIS